MKVSVISLAYNHARYARQTLEGFIGQQTDFPFEVLVNDDASTDGTREIIEEYAGKRPEMFRTFLRTENQYSRHHDFSRIIRELVENARGEYIAYCECDDYWTDPEKLQMQADYLDAHPDTGLVYTRSQAFFQTKGEFGEEFGGYSEPAMREVAAENRIPTQSIMFRRDLFLRYAEEVLGDHGADWLMADYPIFLWMAANSKIGFIPRCTAVYRIHDAGATHHDTIDKWLRLRINTFEIAKYFTDRYKPELSPIPERRIEAYRLERAMLHGGGSGRHVKRLKELGYVPDTAHERRIWRFRHFPALYRILYRLKHRHEP